MYSVVVCLLVALCCVVNHSDSRRLRNQTTRRLRNTTIEYYTTPKQAITVDLMIHVDKVLTKHLAAEYRAKTRKKIKTITNNILKDAENLYKHPSLNQRVRFKLIDTRFMKNNSELVDMNENVSKYLRSYCKWQGEKKAASSRGYYSVLLTGLDLYYVNSRGDKVRSSTGRGYMNGICNVYKSCTVLEWHPHNTGYLLAHELAHSLGMSHDGPPNNNCEPQGHIMASKYNKLDTPKTWTSCNRQHLEQFLKSNKGRCLQPETRIYHKH